MNIDPAEWTICYRKRTANRFFRVTNWSGTWSQALGMAQLFAEANPELEVYYTSTAASEAAGRVVDEDIANILIEGKNKRIKIVEKGELPQDMIDRMPAAPVARLRWLAGEKIADAEPAEVFADKLETAFAAAGAAPVDLIIKFERIGRPSTPEAALTLHVPAEHADTADRVAYFAFRHCRRHLLSRDFVVQVDLVAGTVSLEGGRYGRGLIKRAAPSPMKEVKIQLVRTNEALLKRITELERAAELHAAAKITALRQIAALRRQVAELEQQLQLERANRRQAAARTAATNACPRPAAA